ncbi:MAG: hypothetical protein Q9205_006373, partial [Flavoplaca limonia]
DFPLLFPNLPKLISPPSSPTSFLPPRQTFPPSPWTASRHRSLPPPRTIPHHPSSSPRPLRMSAPVPLLCSGM